MKKIIPLLAVAGAFALSSGALLKTNSINRVNAYTKSSLPTTIDLNDSTDSEIRNYYSNLNSLADTELSGQNLLKQLKPILANNQKYYSYDISSGIDIWKMYEITDRDWEKSPASEISGYNSSTNVITGYKYGSSYSKPGSNPYVHALYVDRSVDNQVRAWTINNSEASHGGNKEWYIDREHIWPKSHGFEDESAGGARGDPMHLWAGDSYVNSALHNNNYYGYVDKDRDYTDGKDTYAYVHDNLLGYSRTLGGSVVVFEPCDSDKGDIARAVFYMVARYNYLSGSDSDGIDSDNPNLALTQSLSDWQKSGYVSTTTKTGKMGIMSDLLEWNKLDPVDEYEIHRNNLLFKNFTNNRNPFIDFPQWADIIWGTESGKASPATDVINDADSSLVLTNTKPAGDFKVGTSFTLTATTEDNSPITWSVDDSSIAVLSKTESASGEAITVTAMKDGSTKIHAKATVNGEQKEKVFNVVVGTGNQQNNPQEFDFKEFFEANKVWFIVIGVAAVILIVVLIIVFAKYGSKKTKKKVAKAVKKTVKKSVKSGSKKK